ncbi:MAG: CvpA family protein [Holosporales bacterium]|jgi:membrane protein required for colicin V production|nr:CvpA family protein [Holosporales bacterium]
MAFIPSALSTVDCGVIIVLALSSCLGFIRGFTKEALGLCSWVGALCGTTLLQPMTRSLIAPYVHHSTALFVCSLGGSFLILLLLGGILTHYIVNMIHRSVLSSVDRTLGLPFGFARGYFFVSCVLLGYTLFSGGALHPAVSKAELFPFVQSGASWMRSFLESTPDALRFFSRADGRNTRKRLVLPTREKLEDFIAPRLRRSKKRIESLDNLIRGS